MTSQSPDYALIDRAGAAGFLFYPRRDTSQPPAGATDLMIEVEPGVSVAARFYSHDRGAPTILYFHGNGEIAADHDGIAPMYREIGLNLFVAEFRGYGKSGGTPAFASLVSDSHPVAAAFRRVLDEDGHTGRRYVMGRSLGSHPALEIAAHAAEGFDGLIIESGAANLRRLVGMIGMDAESGPGHELVTAHEAKVRSIRLPVLIIHGEYDELIPVTHAAELYDMLEGTARELQVIPGAGHNDILWLGQDQYFESIDSFVNSA
jgi:uncharacterized protein